MFRKSILGLSLCLTLGGAAHAGEACQSAKMLVKMSQTFFEADADRIDLIAPEASLQMTAINGASQPDGLHYFLDDTQLTLPLDADGYVQNLETAAKWSKDGKVCRVENGEIAPDSEEDTMQVNMSFVFPFRRQDGQFTFDELQEGAKDGSKIMNGLAPGGLGFAVPGLKTIAVRPVEEGGALPTVTFLKDNQPVDITITKFKNDQMVLLKTLKSAKVDKMIVTGPNKVFASFKFDPEEVAKAEAKRLADAAELAP